MLTVETVVPFVRKVRDETSGICAVEVRNLKDLKSKIKLCHHIYIAYCSFAPQLNNTMLNIAFINSKHYCFTDSVGMYSIAGSWGTRFDWYFDDTVICSMMDNGYWVGKIID